MNTNVERFANIDILRIISILMVLTLHALGHGGILFSYNFYTMEYQIFWLVESLCMVAVNCFILITGYLMVNSTFKASRLISTISQVEFYSILCTVVTKYIWKIEINVSELFSTVFPISNNRYWYMSCYIILLMLMPLLNKYMQKVSKQELLLTIYTLIFIFCLIPNVIFWSRWALGSGYTYPWFVVMYMIGGYFKLYGFPEISWKKAFILYLSFSVGSYITRVILEILSMKSEIAINVDLFYCYNTVTVFPASVFLFESIIGMKINKRIAVKISKTGKYTLGAYLCSDNDIIRERLWTKINLTNYISKGIASVIIYLFCAVILIFFMGCMIELIRQKLEKLIIDNTNLYKKIDNKFEYIVKKFL